MLDRFFKPGMYVRIAPDRIRLRAPRSGAALDEPPLIAIADAGNKKTVAAVGQEAARMRGHAGTQVLNPFDHPRIAIGDFVLAEQLLKQLTRRLFPGAWFLPAPTVVVHLDRRFEGGLTPLEVRALQELAIGGAGASRAIVWEGPALGDEQVARLDLPTTGEVLSDSGARPPRR